MQWDGFFSSINSRNSTFSCFVTKVKKWSIMKKESKCHHVILCDPSKDFWLLHTSKCSMVQPQLGQNHFKVAFVMLKSQFNSIDIIASLFLKWSIRAHNLKNKNGCQAHNDFNFLGIWPLIRSETRWDYMPLHFTPLCSELKAMC